MRHLQDAGVFVRALAVEQPQTRERDAVQNFVNGLSARFAPLGLAQVRAVVGLALDPLVADRTLALLVIALHRDLADDPLAHEFVRQAGLLALAGVEFPHALDPPARVVLEVVRRDDPADDVRELLRVLQVDLLVDGRGVARREFLGQEVVAVSVRPGPAEHEGELRVSVRPGLHPLGAQGSPVPQPDFDRKGNMEVRGGLQWRGFFLRLRARRPLADEEPLLGVRGLAVLRRDGVVVLLRLHPALAPQRGDDLRHLLLVGIGVVAVGDEPVWDVFRVREKRLEEPLRVALGHRLVVGLVILDLRVGLEREPLPVSHQPFDEVVGLLVVGRGKLGGVGGIEINEVGLDPGEQRPHFLAESLARLAAVEHQRVDPLDVPPHPLPELVGIVLPAPETRRGREMPEAPLAAHAGLAQREQRDVLLVPLEPLAVAPDRVDDAMHPLGEEDPAEVVPHERPRLRVVRQERVDLLAADARLRVLDQCPRRVVAVVEPVVGRYLKPLALEHVGHDRRSRERVQDRLHIVRRVLPDPVHQLLLRADVVRDVPGPLVRRKFARRALPGFPGLRFVRLGFPRVRCLGVRPTGFRLFSGRVRPRLCFLRLAGRRKAFGGQVKLGFRFQQKRQTLPIRGKQFHLLLPFCDPDAPRSDAEHLFHGLHTGRI